MFGFLEAVRDWKLDGDKFSHFARQCIDCQLKQAVKGATRRKHQVLNTATSLNKPITDKHGQPTNEERLDRWVLPNPLGENPIEISARDESRQLLEELMANLSNLERMSVVGCLLGDESYNSMGARLGRPGKAVDNALCRARDKLRRRAAELATDPRFTPETRAMLMGFLTASNVA